MDDSTFAASLAESQGSIERELETLLSAEPNGLHIVLDLKDLTLVDQDTVNFLRRREADNVELRNCPAYIREWITGQ